jgi:hypothetical protein
MFLGKVGELTRGAEQGQVLPQLQPHLTIKGAHQAFILCSGNFQLKGRSHEIEFKNFGQKNLQN